MTLDDIIESVLAAEGGYSNHPNDAGGETNYGITVSVARHFGYTGPMVDMPRQTAKHIYLDQYVVAPKFDKVFAIDPHVGVEVVDTGVNMGPLIAAKMLQRALNLFNKRGEVFPDLVVDGQIGQATLNALFNYINNRGDKAIPVLLKALNCFQGVRYAEIAEANQKQEDFTFGWFANRVYL
jgi:lysozyme family protein